MRVAEALQRLDASTVTALLARVRDDEGILSSAFLREALYIIDNVNIERLSITHLPSWSMERSWLIVRSAIIATSAVKSTSTLEGSRNWMCSPRPHVWIS